MDTEVDTIGPGTASFRALFQDPCPFSLAESLTVSLAELPLSVPPPHRGLDIFQGPHAQARSPSERNKGSDAKFIVLFQVFEEDAVLFCFDPRAENQVPSAQSFAKDSSGLSDNGSWISWFG